MPRKRHPALQDLSHDHQLFMEEARQIRWFLEGDERAKSLEEVIDSILSFWDEIGQLHLQEEEDIIYPAYLKKAPLRKRDIDALYTDHNWLREKFQELSELPRFENVSPLLRSLTDYVVNHVRHEEKVIYNAIQDTLDADLLNTLAEKTLAFRKSNRKAASIRRTDEYAELPDIEESV